MQGTLFGTVAATQFEGTTIYETRGRAREYRELACNLYTGCGHGCVYCYAPDVVRRSRDAFYGEPAPRAGILRGVEADARRYAEAGETRQVLFSFTSDPYQPIEERYGIVRQAIQACHRYGVPVCVLTKGGKRALRDIDLFGPRDAFASTLTLLDASESAEWEPLAATPDERMATLAAYHASGVPTWVSLEPVIDPETTLEIIRKTHTFVDEFKVGVLNYHPRGREIDWRKFALDAVETLEEVGAAYYLKYDLRAYLG